MSSARTSKEIIDSIKNIILTGTPAVILAFISGQALTTSIVTMLVMPMLPIFVAFIFAAGLSFTTSEQATLTIDDFQKPIGGGGIYENPSFIHVLENINKLHIKERKHAKFAVYTRGAAKPKWDCITYQEPRELLHIVWEREKSTEIIYFDFGEGKTISSIKLSGKSLEILREFVEESTRKYNPIQKGIKQAKSHTMKYEDASWSYSGSCEKTFKTTFLPAQTKDLLLNDLNQFKKMKPQAEKFGVFYKRGYMFHGAPGCGKSSIVSAIANYMNMPVFIFELHRMKTSDLNNAIRLLEKGSILLFDDVDTAPVTWHRDKIHLQQNSNKSGNDNTTNSSDVLDLGTLLGILDGHSNLEGSIIIMNTNHPEFLDPALIREGRIDIQIEIKPCNFEQLKLMVKSVFPEHIDTVLTDINAEIFQNSSFKVAEILSTWLIMNYDNPVRANEVILSRLQQQQQQHKS